MCILIQVYLQILQCKDEGTKCSAFDAPEPSSPPAALYSEADSVEANADGAAVAEDERLGRSRA